MAPRVLLQERGQGVLGLGADHAGDARWDDVEDHDPGVVAARERVRELERKLRVGPAADRHEDPADLSEGSLLDDRAVARRLADAGVDGVREDRARARGPPAGRPAAPAEDQHPIELPGGLHDALGRAPADPHQRPDPGALRCVVQDLLEEPPRLAGLRGTVGQGDVLRHFHDPERGQLAARDRDGGADG
jgi:hypothetical protein